MKTQVVIIKLALSLLCMFIFSALAQGAAKVSDNNLANSNSAEEIQDLSSDTQAQVEESLWNRESLTGDWGGFRKELAEKGVNLDLEFTEYYQGVFSGTGNEDFEFGGRVDALVNFITEKLGLWKGGGFHTHLTYRSGGLPAFRDGALWPVSTGSILPFEEKDNLVATSLYLSQRIGDSGSLLIGKINAVDLLAGDPFFGGWGNHRFMHLALVAPPSGVFPPVIMGTIFNYQTAPYTITLMAYDPHDRTGDYWVDDLFSDGVNLSLGVTRALKAFGRPSSINLAGTYSTEDKINLKEILLPPELRTGTEDGAYNISIKVSHLLLESSVMPGQGLGIYGKGAIADGNPNPIEGSFSGGISGHSIIPERPDDSFGIGYFYYNFSSDLKSAIAPLINLNEEHGVEIFYNLAITPWFRLSGDIQWIDPATGDTDLWIGALRVNVKL